MPAVVTLGEKQERYKRTMNGEILNVKLPSFFFFLLANGIQEVQMECLSERGGGDGRFRHQSCKPDSTLAL